MKKTTITCDGCGKDITETGPVPMYRLRLSCEPVPHSADTHDAYSVIVAPPIDSDMYFCDLDCLKKWLSAQ